MSKGAKSKSRKKAASLSRGKKGKRSAPKSMPNIKLHSPEFNKLQSEWYSKLRKDGFEDIEWVDSSTGVGQGTPYLKNSAAAVKARYKPETEVYFRMVNNFLVHYDGKIRPRDLFVLKLHSEGVSYRKILKAYCEHFVCVRSLFYVFYKLKKWRKRIIEWNKENPEGLLYKLPLQ